MKNGVPITAVRIPSGISTCAEVRASVSMTADNRRREWLRSATAAEIRADQRAREMRNHQPDPADDSGRRDARRSHERRGGDDGDAERPGATPSARASSSGSDITFMRQRRATSTPVPSMTGPSSGSRSETAVAAETAEQPEGHGRKLVVGIGEIFHEADSGAEQRADHDAGQHQHENGIA